MLESAWFNVKTEYSPGGKSSPQGKGSLMKIKWFAVVLVSVAFGGAAFAGDIYKWVDEDGNVHYGDKPAGDDPQRLAIASQPTDPARVQAQLQTGAETRASAREARAAAAEEEEALEEQRAEAAELAQKCEQARATMQRFVTSRRLYREDDDGERTYLDEAEMQAARQRVEDQISQHCSPN